MTTERRRPLPYRRWHQNDHRSHRVGGTLTCLEEGMMHRLLDHQWEEGAIPDDLERMAEICRVTFSVMADGWVKLQKLFRPMPQMEGVWVQNPRLESERTADDVLRAKRVLAGKQGGRGKQKKANESKSFQTEVFDEGADAKSLPDNRRVDSPYLDEKQTQANESTGKQTTQERESSSSAAKSSGPDLADLPDPCLCGGSGGLHKLNCPIAALLRVAQAGGVPIPSHTL